MIIFAALVVTFPTPQAAAASAAHCFSPATRLVSLERRPLPRLPLPKHLRRDARLTRLYLVTYRLLKADAVDKPGLHSLFAYVARPTRSARWRVALCATGP